MSDKGKQKRINIYEGPKTEAENRVLVEAIRYVRENLDKNSIGTDEGTWRSVSRSLLEFGKLKIIEAPEMSAIYGLTDSSMEMMERTMTDVDRQVMNDYFIMYTINSRYGAAEELGIKSGYLDVASLFSMIFGEGGAR